MATVPAPEDRILSVGELTRAIKELLAGTFPGQWVKGELSGFKGPQPSGHLYFKLKDASAQLDCAMFKSNAMRLGFTPKDGLEVEAFGEISVYEPRGSYQLVIKQMRVAGIGALLAQLEELKRRLSAEGLFAAERKQPLPRYPDTIGVVTSPVGAAVRDIVKVLRARWPGIRIVLAPVKVQGEGAAAEIAAAIERFDRWGGADLLIVGRGGGSIEDLWAFNEEVVVRAIAAARTPIISAVGHEVDTPLADHAADVRAATPSNAAEIAVRDVAAVRRQVAEHMRHVDTRVRARLDRLRHALDAVLKRHGFHRIKGVFEYWQQRMDEQRERLDAGLRRQLVTARERLMKLLQTYGLREALRRRIADAQARLGPTPKRLTDMIVGTILKERQRTISIEQRLLGLSPKEVLKRGYALVKGSDGTFVRSAEALAVGEGVTLEFARGEADATVTTIRKGGSDAAREGRRRRE